MMMISICQMMRRLLDFEQPALTVIKDFDAPELQFPSSAHGTAGAGGTG